MLITTLQAISQTVSIGTGTTATYSTGTTATSVQSPYNAYYGYSYAQTLYLQSEIKASGSITAIQYYFTGTTLANSDQIKVYMGETSKSSFSSNTDWIPLDSLTMVFDGTLTGSFPGWVTINLSTPFNYTNTRNLVIGVDENKASYDGTEAFRTTNLNTNRVIFYRNDDAANNPDPAMPFTANGRSSMVANIQIEGLTLAGCQQPTGLAVNSITATSANIEWNAPAGGSAVTQYNWELRTTGAAGSGASGLVNSGNTSNTTFALSTLSANTSYNFYVRTKCGTDSSAWTAATFKTLCTAITAFPYTEGFEATTFPSCWASAVYSGTNNWTVGTSSADIASPHVGSRFIYKGYNTSTANLISAPLNLTSLGANQARISVSVYRHASTVAADAITFYVSTDTTIASGTEILKIYPLITQSPAENASGWYKYTGDIPVSFNTSGTVYIIVEGKTTGGFSSYDLGLDNFIVEQIPSCEPPTALTSANITDTTAELSWTAPTAGTPLYYQMYVSTSNTAPTGSTTPTKTNISTTPYALTALTPNTTYYVWVRANCGPGDSSSWSSMLTFKTACVAVNALTQNFDGVTAPELPDCWGKLLRGATLSTFATVTTATGNANSTPNSVSLYNSSSGATDDIMLVSPLLNNLSSGTHRLKFWAINSTASQDIEVGTLDNLGPNAVFNLVQTVDVGTAYAEYTVDFSSYAGTDKYIALRRLNTSTYTYVYIDDVKWEPIPTCEAPTALVISALTTTGVQLDWSAPSVSSPTSYQVYWNTTGTEPKDTTTPSLSGIINTSTPITGLTASTTYYVWVRSVCGASDKSVWSMVKSFTTPCNPVNVPYAQNFETAVVPALPLCTSQQNAGTGNNWSVANNPGSTFTNNTLQYLYNTNNAANVWFFTQAVNLTAGTSYRLTFKYGNNSTTYTEKLKVKFGLSPTANDMTDSITDLPSIKLSGSAISTTDFTPSATGAYYLGFQAYSAADQYNLYVDDILLTVTPTCEAPTGLFAGAVTPTGAEIDWIPSSATTAASFDIYYSTSSTAPADTVTPKVSGILSNPYSLTGLNAGTTYYVWVRANCGSGAGLSSWALTPVSFTTICTDATAINENFDGVTTPALPSCWSKIIRGTGISATATITTTASNANSSPNAVSLYNSGSSNATDDMILVSPPLSNLAAGTYRLKFFAKNGTASQDLQIGTLDSATKNATFTLFQAVDINTSYQEYTVDFSNYSGTDKYIGIRRLNTSTYTYVYLDDIRWEVIPTCEAADSLSVSNITTSGAKITWTPPSVSTPATYDVYYSITNTAPINSTTPSVTGVTALNTTITGLLSNTSYYVWVRSDCGGSGGKSPWSIGLSFRTLCDSTVVPYSENFETAVVPALPACTQLENLGNGNNWTVTNNPGSGFTSKTLQYTYNSTSPADVWFYTRGLYLTAGTTYTLKFRYGNNSTTYEESLEVKYGTAPAASAMNNLLVDFPSISINGLDSSSTDFTPATTGVYYIGFHAYSEPDMYNLYVDNIEVTAANLLPVTMMSFTGERKGTANVLNWKTASELNNAGFAVERSADGSKFSTIAFVASKAENGSSNNTLNYAFVDDKPLNGTNYYRLKQQDKDGKTSYSNIVMIKGVRVNEVMFSSVYPNPATKDINVVITSPFNGNITIVVTDISGRPVVQRNVQTFTGDNKMQLNIANLTQGVYFIKAICNDGCETAVFKFLKH